MLIGSFLIFGDYLKRFITDNNQLINKPVSSVLKDSEGIIWVGYTLNGLLRINPFNNSQQELNADDFLPKGLRSNSIRDIYEDKSGMIWIATKYGGSQLYDRRQETFTQHLLNKELSQPGINKGFVLSIKEIPEKGIWIGTKKNGVFFYDYKTEKTTNFSQNSSPLLKSNRIEDILVDNEKNTWFATQNGLYKLSPNLKNLRVINKEKNIRCIISDSDNKIWIGSNSTGIYIYSKNSKEIQRFSDNKNNIFFNDSTFGTRKIAFTSDSLLWVATFQRGLYKYNIINQTLKHFTFAPNDSLSIGDNMARSIFEDDHNNVWVGTKSSGLYKYIFNSQKFQRQPINSLPDANAILNIQQDDKGFLWLGTSNGLIKFDPQNNSGEVYTGTYGLKNLNFETNASCKTSTGDMLFGGRGGVNVFEPEKINKKVLSSTIIFPSIRIYDKIITRDVNSDKTITLTYDDKYLFLDFILTNYAFPLRTKYYYQLNPFDTEWINNDTRNTASYTALPPGKYIFKVKAICDDDIKEHYSNDLTIIVTRPFWQRTFFYLILAFSLLMISTVIYSFRIRFTTIRQHKLQQLIDDKTRSLMEVNAELEENKSKLAEKVEERTSELEIAKRKAEESDHMKSAFLANMSHEIRTPLNAIIGLSKILLREVDKKPEFEKVGKMIDSSSETLQQLINDIIDISKIEANQLKIFKDPFPVNECLQTIHSLYTKQLELTNEILDIKLFIDIPEEEIYLNSDQNRIEQIIRNLINNAIKFTKKGSITVGYTIHEKENKSIQFYVKDTGTGISKDNIDSIFDRFNKSETKENISMGGTGLGLSICYNLVKLLEGNIWVESEIGKGSVFYFELPLDNEEDISFKELNELLGNTLQEYNWKRKAVLVAEDTEANYMVIEDMLSSTGIDTVVATDGEIAVNFVKEDPKRFNIVLMDINMPGMNGTEAMKHIKKLNSSIPIVAQTALAMDHESKAILKMGFDAYISKPIKRDSLLKLMNDLMI